MLKAAIFDLDGTLANTLPDILTAINGVRALHSLPPVDEDYVLGFINGDSRAFIDAALPGISEKDALIWINEYRKIYATCYMQKTHAYSGVTEMLSSLAARGVKLAVYSNKDDDHVRSIVSALFPNIFDITLGAGKFAPKPAPNGLIDILSKLGVKKNDAVYVGDSDVDIITGNRAEVKVVGVSWGYRGRAFLENFGGCDVVDTPSEITRLR